MRTYGQYCGLARALDVVGDRWTLLIARELLIRGPSRYTDLRDGLPGIATNLLVERLRQMEGAGLVERRDVPPPVATTLFALTARGEELETVIAALGRWSRPLMGTLRRGDAFRAHWLGLHARLFLRDRSPGRPPVRIEVRTAREAATLVAGEGGVRLQPGSAPHPDLILDGPPPAIMGVLTGRLSIPAARRAGLRTTGNAAVLRRIQPRAASRVSAGRT